MLIPKGRGGYFWARCFQTEGALHPIGTAHTQYILTYINIAIEVSHTSFANIDEFRVFFVDLTALLMIYFG